MRPATGVYANSARGSAGCLCCAFIFALFAVISPFWIWRYAWSWYGQSVTTASGSYVASFLQGRVPCGFWTSCFITTQWNRYEDFNNTLCTGDFYEFIGQFGFCTASGSESDAEFMSRTGVVQTPPIVKNMQGLNIATIVILAVAIVAACASPDAGRGKVSFVAALLSLAAFCTSTAAFSLAVSYDYYQKFGGSGWYLPFTTTEGDCGTATCLILSSRVFMNWGPAFTGMVFVSICTFFSTIALCAAAKGMKNEDDKEYRDFDERDFGGPELSEQVPTEPVLV